MCIVLSLFLFCVCVVVNSLHSGNVRELVQKRIDWFLRCCTPSCTPLACQSCCFSQFSHGTHIACMRAYPLRSIRLHRTLVRKRNDPARHLQVVWRAGALSSGWRAPVVGVWYGMLAIREHEVRHGSIQPQAHLRRHEQWHASRPNLQSSFGCSSRQKEAVPVGAVEERARTLQALPSGALYFSELQVCALVRDA